MASGRVDPALRVPSSLRIFQKSTANRIKIVPRLEHSRRPRVAQNWPRQRLSTIPCRKKNRQNAVSDAESHLRGPGGPLDEILVGVLGTFRPQNVPEARFWAASGTPKIDQKQPCGQKRRLGEQLRTRFSSSSAAMTVLHQI